MSYGRKLVQTSLLLLLLGLAACLLWPAAPGGRQGDSGDALRFRKTMDFHERGRDQGWRMEYRVDEAEVNAYLAERVGQGKGLRAVNLNFTADGVRVLIVTHVGPFPVSYELDGIPVRAADRWTLRLSGGRVGHVPLPRKVAERLGARLARVFAGLRREQQLLEAVDTMILRSDCVELSVGIHDNSGQTACRRAGGGTAS